METVEVAAGLAQDIGRGPVDTTLAMVAVGIIGLALRRRRREERAVADRAPSPGS